MKLFNIKQSNLKVGAIKTSPHLSHPFYKFDAKLTPFSTSSPQNFKYSTKIIEEEAKRGKIHSSFTPFPFFQFDKRGGQMGGRGRAQQSPQPSFTSLTHNKVNLYLPSFFLSRPFSSKIERLKDFESKLITALQIDAEQDPNARESSSSFFSFIHLYLLIIYLFLIYYR